MTDPLSSAAGSETATSGRAGMRPSRRAMLLAGTAGLVAAAGFGPANRDASAQATSPTATTPPPAPSLTGSGTLPLADAPPRRTVVAAARTNAAGHRIGRWPAPVDSLTDFHRHVPAVRFGAKAVMLTLDDGPSHYWTPKFLALLEHLGVHVTFFMIGEQVPRDAGLVREVLARGHVIGNHTWTHDEQLGYRKTHRIMSELERTSDAIHKASGSIGYVPYLFRAPGGTWTPRLLDALGERQLVPVGWDIDPSDWARPGTDSIRHSLRAARPRDVVLCHDGGGDRTQTYRALKTVVPEWQRRGYTFTTLPHP